MAGYNYGGRTCQLDWKFINSNLQPICQLGSDTKEGVGYRQCGNIYIYIYRERERESNSMVPT